MILDIQSQTILLTVIKQYIPDTEIWVFGSRVHGKNLKPFSDIDIVLISSQPIPLSLFTKFCDALEESDIPYKVDVLQWAECFLSLQNIIKQNYEIFYKPS